MVCGEEQVCTGGCIFHDVFHIFGNLVRAVFTTPRCVYHIMSQFWMVFELWRSKNLPELSVFIYYCTLDHPIIIVIFFFQFISKISCRFVIVHQFMILYFICDYQYRTKKVKCPIFLYSCFFMLCFPGMISRFRSQLVRPQAVVLSQVCNGSCLHCWWERCRKSLISVILGLQVNIILFKTTSTRVYVKVYF